tara:strand:- start:141 stop:1346 length:1206 start_codon:yes stop_codon:yes gene_type:complete
MSKILRRPMFRGGPVDSRGTGITSGLMDGGRVGYNMGGGQFKTGSQIVEAQEKKPFLNDLIYSAGMPFPYERTTPFKNIELTDTSVEKEETPTGDILSKMTDEFDVNESNIFEGYENFEDLPKTIQNVTSKTDFNRNKKEQADIKESIQSDINAKGFLPESGPQKGVVEVDDKGGIKLTTDPTGNVEQKTEMSARDLVRENADLFKEFLSEGNEKKLKSARIGDASDYLLKFFEGSQREGATVGSSAAEVAKFATSKDSKTERAKAAIEKTDQTATALAINDYIAGKRSKEQVEAMMAKSDIGFAQAIALADYKKGKENFFDNLKENRKGMGSAEAIITTVQETFKKVPTVLTDKDIKQENFGLLNEENIGEYFVYPDGKVTKIDKIGDELTEVVIYTRGG